MWNSTCSTLILFLKIVNTFSKHIFFQLSVQNFYSAKIYPKRLTGSNFQLSLMNERAIKSFPRETQLSPLSFPVSSSSDCRRRRRAVVLCPKTSLFRFCFASSRPCACFSVASETKYSSFLMFFYSFCCLFAVSRLSPSPNLCSRLSEMLHASRSLVRTTFNVHTSVRNSSTKHVFACVLGSGVAGSSVAYHLTKRNIKDVLLLDRASGKLLESLNSQQL